MPAGLTWREKFRKCREFGFDWIEFSVDESDEKLARLDWTSEERNVVKEAMRLEGGELRTMCLSGHRRYPLGTLDPVKKAKALEVLHKAIGLAADLGIRIIQVPGYDVVEEESNDMTRAMFIENMHTAVKWAAAEGIVLAFETMTTEFMNTVEKAVQIVHEIDSPFLHIYPDVANIIYQLDGTGMDVDSDLQKGRGRIVAAHVKETDKDHNRRIPFGSGDDHAQYVKHMTVLKNMGVRMFNAEFWYQGGDYEEICRRAASFLRERLDQVFEN